MKKHYKIAFCGLGSIGKRHLKNTVKFLRGRGDSYQIDAVRSGNGSVLPAGLESEITAQYSVQEQIPDDYDIIFITNPTSLHIESIMRYQNCTRSFFVEKPVAHRLEESIGNLRKDVICYVACPLRYTKVLQYIKNHTEYRQAYSVRSICSTYLPGWHPQEDYRRSYSAQKSLGGGVAIDLIHEWDYLVWLFGRPKKVTAVREKISALEIDSEDVALYLGRSDTTTFELHLDYFGREEIRMLEMFLPDDTIRANLHDGRIHFAKGDRTVILDEDRDEYQMMEIEHFFDIYEGRLANDNTIEQAMDTLRTAIGEKIL